MSRLMFRVNLGGRLRFLDNCDIGNYEDVRNLWNSEVSGMVDQQVMIGGTRN